MHEARESREEHRSGEPEGRPLMLEIGLADRPGMLDEQAIEHESTTLRRCLTSKASEAGIESAPYLRYAKWIP